MNRFAEWLKSRDKIIHESVSAEELQQHGFDALSYAQQTMAANKAAKEAAEGKKSLHTIVDKLEAWVDADNHGVAKLKLLAGIIKGGNPEDLHNKYYEFKNLEDLQQVFNNQHLIEAMQDFKILKMIAEALNMDFDQQIWPEIAAKHGTRADNLTSKNLHIHGDLGKHYGQFVTSQIKHVAEAMLKELEQIKKNILGEEKPKDNKEKPATTNAENKLIDNPPLGTMASPLMK